jgi:flagellar hook-associated protein 3 FlgL
MNINNTLFPANSSAGSISNMRSQFERLQQQLSTGQKAQTLSELGRDRMADLTIRARLEGIASYGQNIDLVKIRLNLMGEVMGRLDALESEVRTSTSGGSLDTTGPGASQSTYLGETRLREVIELLNIDVNGRYLFGGIATEGPPVASFEEMMNGSDGRDGFINIMDQRQQADLGSAGMGRLEVSRINTAITLGEDAVQPFGMKLDSVSSPVPVTVTQPTGSPPALSIDFTGQPAEGQVIAIGFTLPDGSNEQLEMIGVTGSVQAANEYLIGGTPVATAANFEVALNAAIAEKAATSLVAASNFAAAEDFFTGAGEVAQRVDGPPYDSATALVATNDADIVGWYKGAESGDPRRAVTVRADEFTDVAYGVQANENGMALLVRSLAVLSAQSYGGADPNEAGRLVAIDARVRDMTADTNDQVPGSIEGIVLDLGLASVLTGRAEERQDQQKVTLETMLADLENVSIEEVAMNLLSLQTRLEASYQASAIVSRLSLVNFL